MVCPKRDAPARPPTPMPWRRYRDGWTHHPWWRTLGMAVLSRNRQTWHRRLGLPGQQAESRRARDHRTTRPLRHTKARVTRRRNDLDRRAPVFAAGGRVSLGGISDAGLPCTEYRQGSLVAIGLRRNARASTGTSTGASRSSSLSDLRPPEAHVRIVTSIRSLPGCRQ